MYRRHYPCICAIKTGRITSPLSVAGVSAAGADGSLGHDNERSYDATLGIIHDHHNTRTCHGPFFFSDILEITAVVEASLYISWSSGRHAGLPFPKLLSDNRST